MCIIHLNDSTNHYLSSPYQEEDACLALGVISERQHWNQPLEILNFVEQMGPSHQVIWRHNTVYKLSLLSAPHCPAACLEEQAKELNLSKPQVSDVWEDTLTGWVCGPERPSPARDPHMPIQHLPLLKPRARSVRRFSLPCFLLNCISECAG